MRIFILLKKAYRKKEERWLSLKKEEFINFKQKVNEKMQNVKITDTLEEVIRLYSNQINLTNLKAFLELEPFGQGFKKPLFYIDDHKVSNVNLLKDKYLKFNLQQGFEAICFNSKLKNINNPNYMVGNLEINEFRSKQNCCLNILDME